LALFMVIQRGRQQISSWRRAARLAPAISNQMTVRLGGAPRVVRIDLAVGSGGYRFSAR
jgi:hypothetical protein